ncbi:MAG: hypothetical protein ABWX62_11310 [Microterricola sp.]
MQPRVPIPEQLAGRAFRRADAAAAGLGRDRFNGRDLQRSFRGVRSNGLDLTLTSDRCRAYATRMPTDHAFSHLTAAELLRVPLPWASRQSTALHVSAPPGQPVPRVRGVVGHNADTSLAVIVDGLRVLPPVLVWCQLAGLLHPLALTAAGDFLLGGRRPLASMEELATAVEQWAPRRGTAALRQALPRLRAGVDSPKETELRLLLLAFGLPEPVVNRRYHDDRGVYLGRADLSWPEWRIVIKYEGDQHRTSREIFRQDLARRERFESAGWSVIRATDDDLGIARREFEHTVRARIRRQCHLLGIETAV